MALDGAGRVVDEEVYYSVGGGFVVDADHAESGAAGVTEVRVELPFDSGEELLKICDLEGLSIAEVMGRNERAWRPDGRTRDGLLAVWEACDPASRAASAPTGCCPAGYGCGAALPSCTGT